MGDQRHETPRKAGTSGRRSPGPELLESLTELEDALETSASIPSRFTMRTVEMNLEPREYDATEVRRIRDGLKASQGVFAKLLGVSIKTVQAWEHGNNPPTPTARRLLDIIDEDPKPWEHKLRASAALSSD